MSNKITLFAFVLMSQIMTKYCIMAEFIKLDSVSKFDK